MIKLLKRLWQWFRPRKCPVCGQAAPPGATLCTDCADNFYDFGM